jgi:crotonobetainyl-CoA:carnitine CoA-transferase CaiB-like acyl-CoA transferase
MADHIFGHTFDPPEGPMGYSRVLTPSRRPYETTDGYICLLAYTDIQWERFWVEVGRPELKDDPRFDSLASRADNIEAVYSLAGEFIATRPTRDWLNTLERLEIPCGEIVEMENIPDDPHMQAVGFFRTEDHPTEGKITVPDLPFQFSRTPGSIDRLQPKLGQHSIDILREVGLGDNDIEAMRASGATN